MRFQDTPIRRKLMTMILGTSAVVLVLTCSAFIGYELLTYRRYAIRELSTLGEIIAAQSTGAVAFDNPHDATEILAALKAEHHIVAACLYDKQGKLFSRYPASAPDEAFPPEPKEDGYRFLAGHLVGFTPLIQVKGSDRLGTLYLSSDMEAMYDRRPIREDRSVNGSAEAGIVILQVRHRKLRQVAFRYYCTLLADVTTRAWRR